MNAIRTARTAGILFLIADATTFIDAGLLRPVLNGADPLAGIAADAGRVTAGAFFQVVTGLCCVGIALALYPVLRRHAEGLALASVVFRGIEAMSYVAGALGALMMLSVAHAWSAAGGAGSVEFTGLAAVLLALRDGASNVGIIAFYVGGSCYYAIMLRYGLVPRWLAGWGLASTVLGLVSAVAVFCGAIGMFSTWQIVTNLPIFVNELVLAGWLMVRGFSDPVPAGQASPPLLARPVAKLPVS